ncbi:MAG TPA: GAF domain-containing protein, partial [Candidatus Dormibacteraeota bacterium]|nr:GAF domain-containing protein [Candidatus Dormibacteraeota bacterium]
MGFRTGAAGAAAVLVLAGASLNSAGRDTEGMLLAGVAGLGALVAGAMYRQWKVSAPAAAVAVLVTLLGSLAGPAHSGLEKQLAGIVLLSVGGLLGGLVYRSFADAMAGQRAEAEALNAQLDLKHRAFVAATTDADGAAADDLGRVTSNVASQVGADFACTYLASADGRRFVPQAPGVGLERLRPQTLNRSHGEGGQLLAAVEARSAYAARDENGVAELISYVPSDFHLLGVMAVPMPIGDHVGGFILLGREAAPFSDDDQRLATTLAFRAGARLASAHLVALTRQESARYSLMNELVKEASGKSMQEVLDLVLGRGKEIVRYDAGRPILFQADNTYVVLVEPARVEPLDTQLTKVRSGETILRNLITEDEGIYSGLQPEKLGGTVNEALVPIRSKDGVIGALCLGRHGASGFSQQDV